MTKDIKSRFPKYILKLGKLLLKTRTNIVTNTVSPPLRELSFFFFSPLILKRFLWKMTFLIIYLFTSDILFDFIHSASQVNVS